MPFSHRIFCREPVTPSLSEVLVWLRQHDFEANPAGGRSAGDALSTFWEELKLSVAPSEPPLTMTCARAGTPRFMEEISDFTADLEELPGSAGRARVLEHIASTRALIIIEFGPEGGSRRAHYTAESVAELLVQRAGGLAQRDGEGFLDEDDALIIPLG